MKTLIFYYFKIRVTVQYYLNINEIKTMNILTKYLPGITSKEKDNECIANINIKFIEVTKKKDVLKVLRKSFNCIEIEFALSSLNEFTILGLLKPAVDYILSGKYSLYFLHSAGFWINDKAVLLWGTRAAGKTTIINYYKSNNYRIVNDERIGISSEDNYLLTSKWKKYLIPVNNLSLMLVPYIIPEGPLKIEPINEESFLHELFHEASITVRCLGAYQGTSVLQSLDNQLISKKRIKWCKDIVAQMKNNIYFIEGTVCDIFAWINNYFKEHKI